MTGTKLMEQLMSNARSAQAELDTYSQEQIDVLCRAIAKAIYDHAEILADMAVEETGMGVHAPEEVSALRSALFPGGVMNKALVGKTAAQVAAAAGISVPDNTSILLVKVDNYGTADDLSKEKMAPVQTLYSYKTWDEAIRIAGENLHVQGAGHTVAIHSHNEAHVENVALKLPASRFLINQICSTSNGGSFFNGLRATTTLGCGSWGNNSISENLNWRHLFNVSRIAYVKPGSVQPSDEEIWTMPGGNGGLS